LSGTALLGACGDSEDGPAPPSIAIAAVTDRTGPEATPSWGAAIELAVADMNAALEAGGNDRFRFTVLPGDTGGSEEQAIIISRQLVVENGAKAVIGSASTETLQVGGDLNYNADESQNVDVPLLCGACTSNKINGRTADDEDPSFQASMRDEEEWMFRTVSDNGVETVIIMDQILTQLGEGGDVNGDGVFKIGVYGSNSTTGGAFTKAMKKEMAAYSEETGIPGFVEETQYDRDANPATYDYGPFLVALTDNVNSDPVDPDDADSYYPDAIVGQALSGFEAGITNAWKSNVCFEGHCDTYLFRRTNFRHQAVVQSTGENMNGFDGLSFVLYEQNQSGTHLAETLPAHSGTPLQLLDAQFYDGAALILLAAAVSAEQLEDPTTVTGRAIADAMMRLADKSGTRVYGGSEGLQAAVEAIAAGEPLDYEGASGPVDFTEANDTQAAGNVYTRMTLFHTENETFIETDLFDCVADPGCPRTER
jgi:hypothetical protein